MIKNYFKIAWRNIKSRKVHSLINIMGLALGIACVIVIFTMVKYHLSFDTFHPSRDRIYRITTEFHMDKVGYSTGVPAPLANVFRNDFTLTEKVARIANMEKKMVSISPLKKFEEDIAFVEPEFFEMFNFPLVGSDRPAILKDNNTAFITERIAKKYFGSQEPIGQTLHLDDTLHFTVAGVLRDLPANTDFRKEIYFPFANLRDHSPWMDEDWWLSVNKSMQCFVRLKPGISADRVDKALADISDKSYNKQEAKMFRFVKQPIEDIHFNANLNGYIEKKNIWALAFIGILLTITTCINFVNLTIARALGRSKEIGVRKVLGSHRWQLFLQFIIETSLMAFLAMLLAFTLSAQALPYLNDLFSTKLSINIFQDAYLMIFLPLLFVVVVLLSGVYPGLIIAGFQPILALKNKMSQKYTGNFPLRKTLVIVQFAISQLLIISTIVIANQMRYSRQADPGFQKDAIIMLPVPNNEPSRMSTLRSLISQVPGVEKMTLCSAAPAAEINPSTGMKYGSRAEGEKFSISFKAGDYEYIPTFGLQILAGRNLYASDTIREYLINETTVKELGLTSNQEVIGQKAVMNGVHGTIVGVVKDFHNKSFHQAIDPIYISTSNHHYENCAVKINMANLSSVLGAIEKNWKEVFPNFVYKFNFLDEQIEQFYRLDNMILRLIQIFTGISIVVGCFGLYGLISFMAAQKTKEVGIRKVMGASVENIVWLFGKEFIQMLIIAFIIATPIGWWVMSRWLDTFVYRINMGVGVFLLAVSISLLIAALTVGYKSIKAALVDPVKSLRSE